MSNFLDLPIDRVVDRGDPQGEPGDPRNRIGDFPPSHVWFPEGQSERRHCGCQVFRCAGCREHGGAPFWRFLEERALDGQLSSRLEDTLTSSLKSWVASEIWLQNATKRLSTWLRSTETQNPTHRSLQQVSQHGLEPLGPKVTINSHQGFGAKFRPPKRGMGRC